MSKDASKKPEVSVRDTSTLPKPQRKAFPGPPGARAPLRVTFDRGAYSEIVAHAQSSLEAEVCGVLAGQICTDDQGLFVHVQACVRGAAASEGSTHVTFTQETWTHIHETMDRDYPKLRMVGWYHTHPGFGVEFSEMDLFIQRNFFSGEAQIALVTDPLSGASAVITSLPDTGITYLPHYWVDGRQQTAMMPQEKSAANAEAMHGATPAASAAALKNLETRLEQLTQNLEGVRNDFYWTLLFSGAVVCLGVIVAVSYFIHSLYVARNEPPQLNGFMPVPVQIGDKKVLLGVNLVSWNLPPELDALLLEEAKAKVAEEEKAKEKGDKPEGKETPDQAPPTPKPDGSAPAPQAPAPNPAPAANAPATPAVPTTPAPAPANPAPPSHGP